MKTFTQYPPRLNLGLILKIVIATLWLLCIASVAFSAPAAGNNELPLAPSIGQNPVDRTVCSGSSAAFTIGSATGTGTVTIRWEVSANGSDPYIPVIDDATYSGATTVALTINNVTSGLNGSMYRCVISDGSNTGTITTPGARLTVRATPAVRNITRVSNMCENASGSGPRIDFNAAYSYKWQLSTNNGGTWRDITAADGYTGYNTNDLFYPIATIAMNGTIHRYVLTDNTTLCSNTSIGIDTLRIISMPTFPTASGKPTPDNALICPGDDTSFTATVSGVLPMEYKWQIKSFLDAPTDPFTDLTEGPVFSGVNTTKLKITGFMPLPGKGNQYDIRIWANYPDAIGCASFSNTSALQVRTLPAVSLQPVDITVCANTDTSFRVMATGSSVLGFQWQTDNGTGGATWTNLTAPNPIPPTRSVLPVRALISMNGWQYRVIVSNACSPPAISNPKTLTVRRSGTWLGKVDTKWEVAGNWCGGVPDNTIDVFVPNNPTNMNMPVISDNTLPAAFYKSLTIENAARLTISGGVIDNMTGPFDLQGTVAYVATRDQDIYPANHGSLEINGSGNKVLGSNVDISRNLVLAGTAKLVTGNNILTMKTGSNTIVTGAFADPSTSWVVTGNGNTGAANTGLGGLRIEQIDAFRGAVLFPVGPTPAAYNPMTLTNAGTIDNFTVAVNDQTIPGGIFASGINRTWSVSEIAAGGSNVMLNVRWQIGEEQSAFDRNLSQIIRSNGTYVVETTLRTRAEGSNPYNRADGSFSSLTLFSVASAATPLPLQLQSFQVQKTGNAAAGITWKTDAQFAVKYFSVQRSNDGSHFTNIAQVNSTAGKTAYSYIDNAPGNGTVYYRLQITGEQNEVTYSPIQSVSLASGNLVQLRPSATSGSSVNVYISLSQQSPVSIYVTDITGRIHVRQSLQLNKGDHQLPVWVGSLSKGVYYVHVKDGKGNATVLTLVKQ